MLTFFATFRFRFLLICCFSACAGTSFLESKEFIIDYEAIINDNNVTNQIDRFLDVGLEYQKTTGKKFKYKKILKKAYKLFDENDAHVPKEVRKDIKKRIKKRIEDRYFRPIPIYYSISANVAENDLEHEDYRYSNQKDDYDYDSFRGAVIESCIGLGVTLIPGLQEVGGAVFFHGMWRVYDETKSYYYREPTRDQRRDENCNGRGNERKRDSGDSLR